MGFDHGITHFDLANNDGPPYGSAEENFGRVMATDFKTHRRAAGILGSFHVPLLKHQPSYSWLIGYRPGRVDGVA